MSKYWRKGLCAVLAVSMLAGIGGCSGKTSDDTEPTQIQTLAAQETEPAVETETETEPETESMYNEDGTRRAWISAEVRLNVREKAGSESEFIGSFPARQEICLLEEEPKKGFYHVSGQDYVTGNEITGYASADYISLDPPEDPKVLLEIESWLQTDSRWSDITLGSTKKTMYDIGCATTSLAMSETFLKGKTIYPDEIADGAIYTNGGEIGWPKDYYWNYNKDMYLNFVYNKLHEGIPVLYGGARRNGRPHWILITGYTGDGENLKAKDFVINDPLPYGRTNLQQYLDEYPVFNKLIYYCKDRAQIEGSEESKAAAEEAAKKAEAAKKKNAAKETKAE